MKNIWIIGASSGIGRDLAIKYAKYGNNVIISARSEENLQELLRDMSKKSSVRQRHYAMAFDVTKPTKVKSVFKEIESKFKNIDLVIFMSGIYKPMSATKIDAKLAKDIINVNLTSVFDILALVIAKMEKQNYGHIALTASVAGYRGLPNSLAYGASKAGLINLAETLYSQLKSKNIDVSVINPGFVKTRLTDQNNFKMPFIIKTDKAAEIIYKELEKKKFEIHFPKKFTYIMKFLQILPNFIYLKLASKLKP